ncbi:MAG: hypothetical protein M1831_003157, partial [Alyxoria varia]
MRCSTQAMALPLMGLATYLFIGSTTAAPLEPASKGQEAQGFDLDTYLHFTDDITPRNAPGQPPNVTVPGGVPREPTNPPKNKKRQSSDGGDNVNEDVLNTSDGHSDQEPDRPPLVWYDRFPVGETPFLPAHYEILRLFRIAAQNFINNIQYPLQETRIGNHRYLYDNEHWEFLIELAWENPDEYGWPILFRPAPRAGSLMVVEEGVDERDQKNLNEWLAARIDP